MLASHLLTERVLSLNHAGLAAHMSSWSPTERFTRECSNSQRRPGNLEIRGNRRKKIIDYLDIFKWHTLMNAVAMFIVS